MFSKAVKYIGIALFLGMMFAVPSFSFAATSLELDARGSDVTTLQQSLISLGFLATGKATGYFGALTEAAVQKFQCQKNIACSSDNPGYGVYGPATQAAMQIALAPTQPSTITGLYNALTPAATGAFETSGWLPYWRISSSTLDVTPHLKQLTSVMPFGYNVDSTGQLQDTAQIDAGTWDAFIAAARAAHTRIVPTVMWGDGAAMNAVLSDSAKRAALETAIVNTVQTHNFDGIDVDFEAKQAETVNYFSTFLKELYAKMGKKWVYCTVEARQPLEDRYLPGDTVPPDATEFANNYIAMNKYCDRVEIMAYDQGTVDKRLDAVRSAPYAPVSDPGWVEDVVRLAAQTISRNKIIIGIPTYGYEYSVIPQSNGTFQYTRLWPFNPKYGTDLAAQLGIVPHRTSGNEIGFTYDPSRVTTQAPANGETAQTQESNATTSVTLNLGSQLASNAPFNYVTWSNAQAIQDKIELAKELHIRGVAFFSLNGGEDQGIWGLLSSR
jgi:spore germination protein